LRDNEGTTLEANRLLEPLFCLRAGQLIRANAPILPSLHAA
jgi:dihydroorotase